MIYFTVILYNVVLYVTMLLFPLYVHEPGMKAETLGFLTAVPGILLFLLRIPGGFLSDYWGEKAVVILSLTAMAMGAGLLRCSRGTVWLTTAQVGVGISREVFWPAGQSYVSRLLASHPNFRLSHFSLAAS